MDEHPGVIFRQGPAGKRPGLISGPDIWEVARVLRDLPLSGDELVQEAADLTGLPTDQVRVAHGYYIAHPDEIEAWVDVVDVEAKAAHPGR